MDKKLILKDIKLLAQVDKIGDRTRLSGKEMASIPCLENAWIYIEDGKIADFGSMDNFPEKYHSYSSQSLKGKTVLPAWVDSHTHIVFAEAREKEFEDKIKGLSSNSFSLASAKTICVWESTQAGRTVLPFKDWLE